MKRKLSFFMASVMLVLPLASCSKVEPGRLVEADIEVKEVEVTETAETEEIEPVIVETEPSEESVEVTTKPKAKDSINLFSYTDYVPSLAKEFVETHPDFEYEFTFTIVGTANGAYTAALNNILENGGEGAPDIFICDADFVSIYTQGEMSYYAAAFEDLGIDIYDGIVNAGIAPYIVEAGTRPSDNKIVGLSYDSDGSVMIYNAPIAEETWGTSDPEEIKKIVGGGSGNWDKFLDAASDLKKSGFYAVSTYEDLWNSFEYSATDPWVKNGQLCIDPEREAFIDMAKEFTDKEYTKGRNQWTSEWYDDVNSGDVFAYFGPSWVVNYVLKTWADDSYGDWRVTEAPISSFWGGSWIVPSIYAAQADAEKMEAIKEFLTWALFEYDENGLQYGLANGDYSDNYSKDSVASAVAMSIADGSDDFLGGQDPFEYYIAANSKASAATLTSYDGDFKYIFFNYVRQYADGEITKEEVIEMFEDSIYTTYGF